jgi:gamma-glutamylcyclotransferase (GGCT)/AIG2-like uncharacterized protein YtfP
MLAARIQKPIIGRANLEVAVVASVFCYGSLMCPDIMAAVCRTEYVSEPALLNNHKRFAVYGEQYPAAIAFVGGVLEGVIYHEVSDSALSRLDAFEGECYQRVGVTVVDGSGQTKVAQCYIFKSRFNAMIAPWDWDFQYFLDHGKAHFMRDYMGRRGVAR